jgi:hypothetical protein
MNSSELLSTHLSNLWKLQKHRAELPAQQSHPPCELVELGLAVGEIAIAGIAEAVFVAARGIR